MKAKTLSIFASTILFLTLFASCTNDIQELETEQSQFMKQIVMTMEDFQPEAGSRTLYDIADGAVKCTWAANDTVGVFPEKGIQTAFPMTSEDGLKDAIFDGGGWALKDGHTYGAYYPSIGKYYLDKHAVPVSYEGQIQDGNGSMDHLGAYDYMVATPTAPKFGSAHFTFKHLSALVQLRLTIPQPTTLTSVKLVAETDAFAVKGKVDIMADAPGITPVTSSNEVELTLEGVSTTEENQVVTLYMMLPPADLSEQTLKVVVTTYESTQEIALEGKNFKAGMAYGLSGEMESTDAGYKDGVVTLAKAGTLKQLLGDDWLNITSLKVVGPIHGDDVRCLRQMLGGNEFSDAEKGKLASLDLSDVMIVKGGDYYYKYSSSINYDTSNDVIGNFMFYKCANLEDIVLSNSLTSIGQYAFSGCSSLTSVNILDGVTSIGYSAFSDCPFLTSITMGTEITLINDMAFSDCPSISSVHIRDLSAWCKITFTSFYSNPLRYGAKLYLNNQVLTELVIPEEITEIKSYAFADYPFLTSVTMGDGVTSIGRSAFYDCPSLTSVTMGNGVISIGDYAFFSCSSLTSIAMGGSVTSIGQETFYKCSSLTTIVIPNGVTLIDKDAFYSCSSLKTVHIRNLAAWCNIVFSNSSSNPLYYGAKLYLNDNELTELAIPTDIKQIKNYAFYNCKSVNKITMGEQVTSVGIQSFRGCSALTQVYCQGTTPPTINNSSTNSSFNGASNNRTLYVLAGCIETYQNSDWAKYFKTIQKND